ncbi:MAG: hypothetical protein EBT46_00830 [Actinobacteria bacterium]|nr:hypothetical protein [Actinomycetota bacterium]
MHPGDSSTTSPGSARRRAAATASSIDSARTTRHTPSKAAAMSSAEYPVATTPRMRCGWLAIDDKSSPLFLPPAINTMRSNEVSAAWAACGLVDTA